MTEYMTGYGTAVRDAVRVMPDGRKVTAIPARVQRYATEHMLQTNRPRVAAYARVSTDQEEQETSFEAQCDYYSRLIRGNPAWEYAGLYTDDGVSATSTARREGLQPPDRGCAGREDRPNHHQVRQPLRPKHRGQPDHHPQAQGKGRRGDV